MSGLGFDALSSYLLVVALATLLLAILVWQPYRSVRTINVWAASGAVGVLLGCSIPCAVMEMNGYSLTRAAVPAAGASGSSMESGGGAGMTCPMTGKPMEGTKGTPGMGGEAGKTCPMTGKPLDEMKGMHGAAAGGEAGKICPMTGKPLDGAKGVPSAAAGGESGKICPMTGKPLDGAKGGTGASDGPQPKRDLTTLVQKLNLLTGDVGITLSAAQAVAVSDCLGDVEKSSKMSDDDAKAKRDKLMAVLDANQKARLEVIGLPHATHGAGCPLSAAAAAKQDENQNPFQQDAEGKAVKSLRERLAAKVTTPKAETPKVQPAKAETPKAQPPKAEAPKSPAAKS